MFFWTASYTSFTTPSGPGLVELSVPRMWKSSSFPWLRQWEEQTSSSTAPTVQEPSASPTAAVASSVPVLEGEQLEPPPSGARFTVLKHPELRLEPRGHGRFHTDDIVMDFDTEIPLRVEPKLAQRLGFLSHPLQAPEASNIGQKRSTPRQKGLNPADVLPQVALAAISWLVGHYLGSRKHRQCAKGSPISEEPRECQICDLNASDGDMQAAGEHAAAETFVTDCQPQHTPQSGHSGQAEEADSVRTQRYATEHGALATMHRQHEQEDLAREIGCLQKEMRQEMHLMREQLRELRCEMNAELLHSRTGLESFVVEVVKEIIASQAMQEAPAMPGSADETSNKMGISSPVSTSSVISLMEPPDAGVMNRQEDTSSTTEEGSLGASQEVKPSQPTPCGFDFAASSIRATTLDSKPTENASLETKSSTQGSIASINVVPVEGDKTTHALTNGAIQAALIKDDKKEKAAVALYPGSGQARQWRRLLLERPSMQ